MKTCSICTKPFNSENPAIKNGKVVCWECSDFTILGTPKERKK